MQTELKEQMQVHWSQLSGRLTRIKAGSQGNRHTDREIEGGDQRQKERLVLKQKGRCEVDGGSFYSQQNPGSGSR